MMHGPINITSYSGSFLCNFPLKLEFKNGYFTESARLLKLYTGDDKSLDRPGRKQANVSVRIA